MLVSHTPDDSDVQGIMFIIRSETTADTSYVSAQPNQACTAYVFCKPYKLYEALAMTITEDDTSAVQDPTYFCCIGHMKEGDGIVFGIDSLSVIMQVDSLYSLKVMTEQEGWFGFIQRGSINKAPVIRRFNDNY